MHKLLAVPGIQILVLGVGGIIALWMLSLWNERNNDLNLARTNSTYVAELMGANVRRSIDDLTDLLYGTRNIAELVASVDMQLLQSEVAFNTLANGILARKPYIRTFFVISQAGIIRHWNREGHRPSVLDRDYVQFHLDNPDSSFYIAPPIRSKLDNDWIVVASLPIRADTGELKAIVAVSIAPEFFAPRFLQAPIPRDLDLGILTAAGEVIWSNTLETGYRTLPPNVPDLAGQGLHGSGSVILRSHTDNRRKLIGYQQLENTPVLVVAAVSIDAILRDWSIQLVISAVAIILLFAISLVVGRRLVVNHQRLLKQYDEFELLAMSDPLTGLPNRRHLWQQAERLIASAKRYQFSIAVIMLDIDHFKKINDTYGHDVGDVVIKALADLIDETARETDLPCRLGGEEFAIAFSHSDTQQATAVAERIREKVKTLSFDSDQGRFRMTVSIGVTALTDSLDDALKNADEALYIAKNSGRDQVVCTDLVGH